MRGIVSKRIIIIFALIFLNACLATHYDVRVNGYTGGESVQFNKNKIFVFKNDSATNSLLEAEIGNKIEKALVMLGYVPVDQLADASYVIIFNYGIDHGSSKTYSTSGYDLNIYSGQFEKTSETGSYTEYGRNLVLNLYKVERLSKKSKPVCVGEVYSRGSSSDIRKVVDYLIVGAFEHFGENTKI